MGKLYDENSIESLSPLEFTRLRPGVYAGDCTYSTQLLVEIFSNCVDEYNAGNGSQIDVTIMVRALFLIVSVMMEKLFLKRLLVY